MACEKQPPKRARIVWELATVVAAYDDNTYDVAWADGCEDCNKHICGNYVTALVQMAPDEQMVGADGALGDGAEMAPDDQTVGADSALGDGAEMAPDDQTVGADGALGGGAEMGDAMSASPCPSSPVRSVQCVHDVVSPRAAGALADLELPPLGLYAVVQQARKSGVAPAYALLRQGYCIEELRHVGITLS
jgi:hypothetical protein